MGRAYGFIQCNTEISKLESSLRERLISVRTKQIPKGMVIQIYQGVPLEKLAEKDSELLRIANQAIASRAIDYTIIASSKSSNYETGLELATVIAQSAMLNPGWYSRNGRTCSRIVYKENQEYLDIE